MNVVDLRSTEARSRALCGGKGAALAALIGEAMPVPDGFIVTTTAFTDFLEHNGLQSACSELHDAELDRRIEIGQRLQREISIGDLPGTLEEQIQRARAQIEERVGQRPLWAVRSSAIAEDTGSASFAGQYDTSLGVAADEITAALRRSWRSSFSERAIRYRAEVGSDEHRMAVLVQVLLDAETAGVCFTVDPVTEEPRIVINANYGFGESVVGGQVSPDTFILDRLGRKPGLEIAGDKQTQTILGPNGMETVEVPAEKRGSLCLSPAEASEIAQLGLSVEMMHGAPVDIEWAYQSGQLFLLQARSITSDRASFSPPPQHWIPASNTRIDPKYPLYSNGNISEVLPGCVTPLSWDHTGQLIEHAFQTQLEALGAIDPSDGAPSVLGFFYHRPYINASLLLEAAARTPGMTPDTVHEELIGKPESRTPAFRATDFLPHRFGRLWRVLRVVLVHSRTLSSRIDACRRSAEADEARFSQAWLTSQSDQSLLEQVRMNHDLAAPSVVHVWASTLASVAFTQLRRFTARWLGDEDGALASELVTGIQHLPSIAPALALQALCEKIARSEDLVMLFRSDMGDAAILEALRRDPLHEELEGFLIQYGHRGVSEAELQRPCWREDPTQIISLMRNNFRPGAATPIDVFARQRRAHEAAMAKLDSLNGWRRFWLKALIRRARSGLLNRERMKDLVIRRLDRSRRVYRELNRRLVARRLIASTDDMFFLRWCELRDLLTANWSAREAAELVQERRRDYRWSRQVDVPKLQRGTPQILDPNELKFDLELAGMGVSPGRVTGTARVVTDPRFGAYIEPGEILVAPVTDVAWTPLFAQAAGLVVEVGGLLSHGSIVAREYGVPTVVGVAGATRSILTGDRISVDGSTGRVRKLEVVVPRQ
jgi:pyruvate,water dikinase